MKKIKLSPDVADLNPSVGRSVTVTADARNAKQARVPRAGEDERVGLTPLLVAGWSVQSPDCVRYRLYKKGVGDTGLCDDLKAACDKAKQLTKEHNNASNHR